jgi:hypothetical protein
MNAPAARLQLSIPPPARFAILGAVAAMLLYVLVAMESAPPGDPDAAPPPITVALPELDASILAGARDGTREQRLVLEVEPLRHLLAKSIDVGPTVATALGAGSGPVPVATIREQLDAMRRRWLRYEGVLEELSGPREGHPIRGYSIYEATVRLADGEHVFAAFSMPPPPDLRVGDWVRVEGFLLKLRDTTYPQAIERAPMLVGREIQRDYEDWPPVTELDPAILAKVEDRSLWPGDPVWHTIEEDQTEALWHLAAYARDTAKQRTAAEWRRQPVLTAHAMHDKLITHQVPRGTPVRIIGSLIQRTFLAAPPNPAGIEAWTVAWVQVREYGGGALVPIWVPKRIDIATRSELEVRAFYYRWFAYETIGNERHRIPLFVAADLDRFVLATGPAMRTVGIWLAGAVAVFFAAILWHQRRTTRASIEHSRDMDARRRRRRERAAQRLAAHRQDAGSGMP